MIKHCWMIFDFLTCQKCQNIPFCFTVTSCYFHVVNMRVDCTFTSYMSGCQKYTTTGRRRKKKIIPHRWEWTLRKILCLAGIIHFLIEQYRSPSHRHTGTDTHTTHTHEHINSLLSAPCSHCDIHFRWLNQRLVFLFFFWMANVGCIDIHLGT